ncbi:MAG TPA: glucosidase, partial [Cyclobacteriaceae bacterium]|nr:glucosidase [Cyclobacteriaceae bacterium]
YPWYAAWDLAFHTIPIAMVDPEFAKHQLLLLTKEWYMHPNGQLPAYEWAFGDVNPPVHGWATWRVYKIDQKLHQGTGDRRFLEEVFHKLMLNFTWWVNKKDQNNNNIFQGGFLGMDNIGVFDRSAQLPTGGYIEQSDGTSWMAMFTLNMMRMSLELAKDNPTYQSLASKFFEHFLYIAGAIANEGIDLWDEEDEFFYDVLHTPDDKRTFMKVRSMVGLIPLFAVEVLDAELLESMPVFTKRLEVFLQKRPDLAKLISHWGVKGKNQRHLLSLLRGHRMKKILKRMLDESEFLSDFGIRALSKVYDEHPFRFYANGSEFRVKYTPGEGDSALFGGNSNWRGPIWFPVNYLLIESLQRFYHYYGDDFKIEHPTGSGMMKTLNEIAADLSSRLVNIFKKDKNGRRPVFGNYDKLQTDPNFSDYLLFYEYFHGDNGRGVGATHQTGWTGLVAKLIQPRRDR